MTAQPKRVRQRKVGLENLKTWDNLKKIQKVENKYLVNKDDLNPTIFVDQKNGCQAA